MVVLKSANNPRATGDGARTLTLNPDEEKEKGNWRVGYGTDTSIFASIILPAERVMSSSLFQAWIRELMVMIMEI